MTPFEEFLAFEAASDQRHEFLHGQVSPVPSKDDVHNTVRGNVFAALHAATRGTSARVYQSTMALRIDDEESYLYPDVMLTSSERDAQSNTFKTEPELIVEICALGNYRRLEPCICGIPSLSHYWVIDTRRRSVDAFSRKGEQWGNRYVVNGSLKFQEIEVPLTSIFESVLV